MSDVFKIIIAGGRDFVNYRQLKTIVDEALKDVEEPIVVVSGGARGADSLAEKYAYEKGYNVEVHHAEWDKFGKSAGYIRNAETAKSVKENGKGMLVAFWDMESRGTANMIDVAERYGVHRLISAYTRRL